MLVEWVRYSWHDLSAIVYCVYYVQTPCRCWHMHECVCSVAQLCLTLCNPMGCSLPASSIPGIFQARILGWVAICNSWVSTRPRDWISVSCISCNNRQIPYRWATLSKEREKNLNDIGHSPSRNITFHMRWRNKKQNSMQRYKYTAMRASGRGSWFGVGDRNEASQNRAYERILTDKEIVGEWGHPGWGDSVKKAWR